MSGFVCPVCGVHRPEDMHLDWCDYGGPEPDEVEAALRTVVVRDHA